MLRGRITVRQLEALVRLSEALARLRCTEKIVPAYVREVCTLYSLHRLHSKTFSPLMFILNTSSFAGVSSTKVVIPTESCICRLLLCRHSARHIVLQTASLLPVLPLPLPRPILV